MPGSEVTIRERTQSIHMPGAMTAETTTNAAVAPSAMASERHSRRTANHSRPIPGVTFVSSTNDQAAGQRKPSTMAVASSRWMLPTRISMANRGMASRGRNQGPASHTYSSAEPMIQALTNTTQGMADQAVINGTKTGE